jgi:hypothetical protein
MATNTTNSPVLNDTNKDSYFETQAKTIFCFLMEYTATASMVTECTGVPQKNICRYKRDFEKAGLLWEVKKDICKATGYKAWYLTTDPAKAPSMNVSQLKLF